MAKTSTAVAKRSNTTPARKQGDAVPAFMKNAAGKGTENMTAADFEMPRIRLVQGTDQELINTHDGLKVGDFFHTLAEVNLGSELDLVILHVSKRVVLWRPRPPIDVGGILARADDGVHWSPADREFEVKIDKKGNKVKWKTAKTVAESGLLDWGTFDPDDKDSQPAATLCHVYVVYMPDHPEYSPAILMLQRSAVKVARKLNGKLNIIGATAPVYGQLYKMGSFLDTNAAAQQFKNYTFTAAGFVEDEKEYKRYEQLHEQFNKSGVQIKDIEGAQEDDSGAGTGGGASATAPKDRKSGRDRY